MLFCFILAFHFIIFNAYFDLFYSIVFCWISCTVTVNVTVEPTVSEVEIDEITVLLIAGAPILLKESGK
jgi:hypothetical protein